MMGLYFFLKEGKRRSVFQSEKDVSLREEKIRSRVSVPLIVI